MSRPTGCKLTSCVFQIFLLMFLLDVHWDAAQILLSYLKLVNTSCVQSTPEFVAFSKHVFSVTGAGLFHLLLLPGLSPWGVSLVYSLKSHCLGSNPSSTTC